MAAPIYPARVTLCQAGPDGSAITGTRSTASITRPANTTAYTAGDAIGQADTGTPANAGTAILTFASVGAAGTVNLIVEARLEIDVTAIPSGMSSFRLHLYDEAPDAILDNAAWDLSSAGDRGKYLGYIDIPAPVDLGSTIFAQALLADKAVKLAAGSTGLYGVLQTIGGYTPTSAAVKKISLITLPL